MTSVVGGIYRQISENWVICCGCGEKTPNLIDCPFCLDLAVMRQADCVEKVETKPKAKLASILEAVLSGRPQGLLRGLRFQYRDKRLFCYRIGDVGPSPVEFDVVWRELAGMLAGKEIALGDEQVFTGQDGRARRGRVFSWAEGG